MFLMKCPKCKNYTLYKKCPACKTKTISAHPLKFSLKKERKYGKYRRMSKQRFKNHKIKSV